MLSRIPLHSLSSSPLSSRGALKTLRSTAPRLVSSARRLGVPVVALLCKAGVVDDTSFIAHSEAIQSELTMN